MTTLTSLGALEAALAAQFPSLRRECPGPSPWPHGPVHTSDYWAHRYCSRCHGLGYVPAVTVDGLGDAMMAEGYDLRLQWIEVGKVNADFGKDMHSWHAVGKPHEAVVRAAAAALGIGGA